MPLPHIENPCSQECIHRNGYKAELKGKLKRLLQIGTYLILTSYVSINKH